MIGKLVAIAALAGAAAIGFGFTAQHYLLNEVNYPADQRVLSHRDSAYTAITWVATPGSNTLQLRFFDRVEGGVCLEPTWTMLAELGRSDPRLAHLVPATPQPPPAPGEATWPAHWPLPDPGTVNSSPYISLFPAGLLLNERLMAAAKGDLRAATPRILIVGLGSGVGTAHLYHHCPQARITVVDIDTAVIGMVRDHYPLLRWLEQDRKQLTLVDRDARGYIRSVAPGSFDLIILDAYTAGSTIPPHLMTREFFAECATALHDDGILMANVIGSHGSRDRAGILTGQQHKVLGGAIRSMRAARGSDGTLLLPHLHCIPIFMASQGKDDGRTFDASRSRNNMIVASRHVLDHKGYAAGWERLRTFVPVGELPTGRWVSEQYQLSSDETDGKPFRASSMLPGRFVSATLAHRGLNGRFQARSDNGPQYQAVAESSDAEIVQLCRDAAAAASGRDGLHHRPYGWDQQGSASILRYTTDWVRLPRECWRVAIAFAQRQEMTGEALTGPHDGPDRPADAGGSLPDAPLFTDQSPNADIWNR